MGARRLAALLTVLAGLCLHGRGAPALGIRPPEARSRAPVFPDLLYHQSQAQTEQTPPSGESSNPSPAGKTVHEKTGPYSSRSVRHTRVAEGVAPPPELAKAEEAIEQHNYSAAEPLLRKVVEHDPGDYVAWFDLGFVQNALGKLDDSIAAYRKSVAAKPDVFESNLNLGLQLAKSGHPEAEKFLRDATQLKPTSNESEGKARAWLSLGSVLEKSNPQEAVAAYHQAATLQPKNPEPHLAAGHLFEQDNKFADAEQEYKQALALDPASDALTGLANIYMRGRHFHEAEEFLRKLVALRPDDGAGHIQLGRVLAAEGKNEEAIPELQAGAKLSPQDVSAQRELADLYTAAGKYDLAESAHRALIAASPSDAELHRGLGQALMRQKKFPEAQNEFFTAVKLKPDFGEAYGDLAFTANENKNYPLTIKALDARAKFLPEIPVTYFLRASAYDHLREYKPAAANYRLFLNSANGKYPDQEWQARHRLIAIEPRK